MGCNLHQHHPTNAHKATVEILLLIQLLTAMWHMVDADVDCDTVTQLLNTCSVFINYGAPDPLPNSPCCDAVVGLGVLGQSMSDRRSICKCIMGLIATYSPNATGLGTLPGFCGVSLGFTIEPDLDCNI